jgi:hypothetical protein
MAHILVIEASWDIGRMVTVLLASVGHTVTIMPNGLSGLRCAYTDPTGVARQRAFDREDEFARLGDLGLENRHIGDVERDRYEWMLRHRISFLRIRLVLGLLPLNAT